MKVPESEQYSLSVLVHGFVYYLASWSGPHPGGVRLHSSPEYCMRFNSMEDLELYLPLILTGAIDALSRVTGETTRLHVEAWCGRGTPKATLMTKTTHNIKTQ
jgi:hypothetical protein